MELEAEKEKHQPRASNCNLSLWGLMDQISPQA